ncbi:hypothetical protein PQX77_002660 [Marasmius sp. AFHP31]|nr:hypothetical protein PQX77_002660 [Marasmius sp. AFHP31]
MPTTTTTTTLTNLATATRTRRSVTSNTSYDSASLDGHSLFSSQSDDMSMMAATKTKPKPIVMTATARVNNNSANANPSTPKKGMRKMGMMNGSGGSQSQRTAAMNGNGTAENQKRTGARVVTSGPSMASKATAAKTPITSSHSSPPTLTTNVYPNPSTTTMRTPPPSNTQDIPPKSKPIPNAAPSNKPNVMMSMTALLEQGDEEDNILHYSIPKSKVLIPSGSSRTRATSASAPKNPPTPTKTDLSPRLRQRTNKNNLMKRRSRSLEDLSRIDVDVDVESSSTSSTQPSTPTTPTPRPSPSTSRPSSRSTTKLPSNSNYTPSPLSRTPHSRSTTTSFSPDGFAELRVGIGNDGQLHLTKNGAQQRCMTCVEVVTTTRGSGSAGGKGKAKALESPFSVTNTRKPPSYVPEGSVLVQVWAVGLDWVDARLGGVPCPPVNVSQAVSAEVREVGQGRDRSELGQGKRTASDTKSLPSTSPRPGGLIRSLSLSRRKTKEEVPTLTTTTTSSSSPSPSKAGKLKQPELGYTPGRSFVGRIVEVGVVEDEREMGFRKGDWVVGLVEVRRVSLIIELLYARTKMILKTKPLQCGALQEFVVVDRRRIFRVPPPSLKSQPPSSVSISSTTRKHGVNGSSPRSRTSSTTSLPVNKRSESRLTIDELALLPLCGVQAYRAVRTLRSEGAGASNSNVKRILVLHGHDGVGAIAAQMLMKHGWKVVVHAPCREDPEIIAQVKGWGGDAVVFDGGEGVVQMMERWIEKGGFGIDAILDTVGGKEVWDVGERLLRMQGQEGRLRTRTESQPEMMNAATPFPPPPPPTPPVPPLPAPLKSSNSLSRRLGSIRRRNTSSSTSTNTRSESSTATGGGGGVKQFTTTVGDFPERPIPSASDHFKSGIRSMRKTGVEYTWVNLAQDIDFEGGDVRDALKRVIRMALEDGVRPNVGVGNVISLDKAPEVFMAGSERGMEDGNTIVVRVVE